MSQPPARPRGGPRRYRRGDACSYALGEWPALEALRHAPERVEAVLLDPSLTGARRERLEHAARAALVPCRDDPATLQALRHRSDALALALVRTGDDALTPTATHLALLATRNAGNLGAALRSALGFDLRDVALIAPAVDPWSPHVLRASLGARFALRVARYADWRAYRAAHPLQRATLFAAPRPDQPGTALPAWRAQAPTTLVFGPEWHPDAAAEAGAETRIPSCGDELDGVERVSIPQHLDLESHNLAVAVGIALYALRHGPC